MKKLIITLGLFCSTFMYSQEKSEFAGVWQAVNDPESILIIYENKDLEQFNFYNYKLDQEFFITESIMLQEEDFLQTNYEDHLSEQNFQNTYVLDKKNLVRSTNGMKQSFNKLNQ